MYRVEGESYIIARDGQVVWDSNRRLFPGGDGVGVDQDHLPTVTYSPARPEQMAVNLGLSGPGRPKGNMLFLNYGECVRADTFFAQRVLQYHEAVDLMKARGMEVLHDHHNMKIRSFSDSSQRRFTASRHHGIREGKTTFETVRWGAPG